MTNPIVNILTELNSLYPPPERCNHYFIVNADTGIPTINVWYHGRVHFCTIENIEDEQTLINNFYEYFTTIDCNELIEILKEIESCVDIINTVPETIMNDEDDSYGEEDVHPLILLVKSLADNALITKSGVCNFNNHGKLADAGFPVRCGDSDSFGWLTGLIKTSKGDIMYG